MDEDMRNPNEVNLNKEQYNSLWKRMERLEEKMEKALDNLDAKVQALEVAHQLQTYHNARMQEKMNEIVEMYIEAKKHREADTKKAADAYDALLARLDDIQFKQKAATYEKVKWMILGFFITAGLALIWAAIVNPPM